MNSAKVVKRGQFLLLKNFFRLAGCRLCHEGESRNISPTATKQAGIFYFDTLVLSKRLQENGFSVEQSDALSTSLCDILNGTTEHLAKNMVTKPQQEITVQQLLTHIQSVKKDMVILEKSEFVKIRNDTEKQGQDQAQIRQYCVDEINKLQNQIKLDINLERSRAMQAHNENEKELQKYITSHDLELKRLENKIDTDIANLQTTYEKYKNDTLKYSMGTIVACGSVLLGFMRLWS